MDTNHSTTLSHQKGKHLTFEERVIIQLRIKDGISIRAIAREIGCSLDACYGRALASKMFTRNDMVCVKTLHNYVDLQLIGIKNHNLPEKLTRTIKKSRVSKNKRKLGRSIEERPDTVELRNEFGHWECDLVLGSKTKDDDVLLTLIERKTREFMVIPLANKGADTVYKAFLKLQSQYSEHFNEVFKTITTDNGSEFADLSKLETMSETLVYYTHPYTSCEKGSVERHNGLIKSINKGLRDECPTYYCNLRKIKIK